MMNPSSKKWMTACAVAILTTAGALVAEGLSLSLMVVTAASFGVVALLPRSLWGSRPSTQVQSLIAQVPASASAAKGIPVIEQADRLPQELRSEVEAILIVLRRVRPKLEQLEALGVIPSLYGSSRIDSAMEEHLPQSIAKYLAISPQLRRTPVKGSALSPEALLQEQLSWIKSFMQDMEEMADNKNVDAMLVQHFVLKSKFGNDLLG